MLTLNTEQPRSNAFQGGYLLPSHWPLLLLWFGLPPETVPPLRDRFPLPHMVRGILWFPAMMVAMIAIAVPYEIIFEPMMTFGLNLINGWPYRPDILEYSHVPGRPFVAYSSMAVLLLIPASILATAIARKPCGIFYAVGVIERIAGEILQAPFRFVKARHGGERRIIEQFDLPPPTGPTHSKYTNFADAWICAPNPDARWQAGSRPELAIKLRYLFTTRYFFRTTLGVMLFFSLMPLYLGAVVLCISVVAWPVMQAEAHFSPLGAWPIGGAWVVVTVGGMIYAAILIFSHEGAYAARAKKRATKGLPAELAVLEAAEVCLRLRYTYWWSGCDVRHILGHLRPMSIHKRFSLWLIGNPHWRYHRQLKIN